MTDVSRVVIRGSVKCGPAPAGEQGVYDIVRCLGYINFTDSQIYTLGCQSWEDSLEDVFYLLEDIFKAFLFINHFVQTLVGILCPLCVPQALEGRLPVQLMLKSADWVCAACPARLSAEADTSGGFQSWGGECRNHTWASSFGAASLSQAGQGAAQVPFAQPVKQKHDAVPRVTTKNLSGLLF